MESKRGVGEGRSQKRMVEGTAAILRSEGPHLVMAGRSAALRAAGGPWHSPGSLGQALQVAFGSWGAGTRQLVISCAKTQPSRGFLLPLPLLEKHGQRQLYQPDYTRRKVFSMFLAERKGAAPIPSLAGEAELLPWAPHIRRAQLRLLPHALSSASRARAPSHKVHKPLQSLY